MTDVKQLLEIMLKNKGALEMDIELLPKSESGSEYINIKSYVPWAEKHKNPPKGEDIIIVLKQSDIIAGYSLLHHNSDGICLGGKIEYPNIKLTTCNGLIDLQNVVGRNPNFVILADKHILINSGQKIWLSEFFDHTNVNYTGSKKNTLQYDLDKTIAKEIVASKGIATADFFTASPDDYKNSQELPLPFPLFLKPTHAANGNGIDTNSLVHDFNQFQTKVMSLNNKYHCPVLVEAYLDGREFTVAIIEKNNVLTAFVLEVAAPMENGIRILSKNVKTNNTEIVSSVTNKILLSEISTIAKNCFRALGARDFGRIDIKMDCLGHCNFIEANLTPGMNKGSSYFPRACEINAKLTYDNVVNLIIQGALERENGKSGNQDPVPKSDPRKDIGRTGR